MLMIVDQTNQSRGVRLAGIFAAAATPEKVYLYDGDEVYRADDFDDETNLPASLDLLVVHHNDKSCLDDLKIIAGRIVYYTGSLNIPKTEGWLNRTQSLESDMEQYLLSEKEAAAILAWATGRSELPAILHPPEEFLLLTLSLRCQTFLLSQLTPEEPLLADEHIARAIRDICSIADDEDLPASLGRFIATLEPESATPPENDPGHPNRFWSQTFAQTSEANWQQILTQIRMHEWQTQNEQRYSVTCIENLFSRTANNEPVSLSCVAEAYCAIAENLH
jgi:hypothetical protein